MHARPYSYEPIRAADGRAQGALTGRLAAPALPFADVDVHSAPWFAAVHPDGSIAAEEGYPLEAGTLLFHTACSGYGGLSTK